MVYADGNKEISLHRVEGSQSQVERRKPISNERSRKCFRRATCTVQIWTSPQRPAMGHNWWHDARRVLYWTGHYYALDGMWLGHLLRTISTSPVHSR